MRSAAWTAVVLFFCVAAMALAAVEAMASTESITQLTSLQPGPQLHAVGFPEGTRFTSISSDGSIVAFMSREDFTGENLDHGAEVFVVNSDGTGLAQLSADEEYWSFLPAISADGSVVAFASAADLIGDDSNLDNSYEIFAINANGSGLAQLTSDDSIEDLCNSWFPSISADGALVAFESDADLTGQNPNHFPQVFVATAGGEITQITSDPAGSGVRPSISADGSTVAFASATDYTEENPDNSVELFIANPDGTGIAQVTNDHPTEYLWCPAISADGSVLAFTSHADLTGSNGDLSSEVFVIDSDGTGLTQLTDGMDPDDSRCVSISADGAAVAFESNADLTGGNSDHSVEIFVVNSDGTGLRQLTNSPEPYHYGCLHPSLSGDGMAVAFVSRADLTGGNPKNVEQVFLASGLFAYTPEGSDVRVEPGGGIDMTFGGVTGGGQTTVEISEEPPGQSPAHFRFLGVYYDVDTTADYEPPITIRIPFDPDALPEGRWDALKVEHLDADTGIWEDVTVYVPDAEHPDRLVPLIDWSTDPPKIVAEVTSLSWFGVGYSIYDFKGFLPPLADSHARPFKRGSTIPIKFRISDAAGSPVPEAGATLLIECGESAAGPGDPEVVSTAPGDSGNEFRYDSADDLYIFNLSTKHYSFEANQSYEVVVTLDDGETYTTTFSLK